MDFSSYVNKNSERIFFVKELFGAEKIVLSFDTLAKKKVATHELVHIRNGKFERPGFFIFGFSFFNEELSEQEFKRVLGQNALNYKIYNAYLLLKKKQKKIKVSELIAELQDKKKDSKEVHTLLRRILTLAYYFNWKLELDKKDLEGDSFISIPNKFLLRLKQRYNFDIMSAVYENDEFFVFLNIKGKLYLVFKTKEEFTQLDAKKVIEEVLIKVFKVKTIEVGK